MSSRDSLRASVLDAALLLGVGTNQQVTDWIFNNPLQEEEEQEQEQEQEQPIDIQSEDIHRPLTPPIYFQPQPITPVIPFDPNITQQRQRNKLRKRRTNSAKDSGYDSEPDSTNSKKRTTRRSFFRLPTKSKQSPLISPPVPSLPSISLDNNLNISHPFNLISSPRKPPPRPLPLSSSPQLDHPIDTPTSPYVIVDSSTIVPSTEFIVPSPTALLHYDRPPPSPPPTGPLPELPKEPSPLNPRTHRSTLLGSDSHLVRGRISPFPPPVPSQKAVLGPGLDARVHVRYRDLYVIGSPDPGWKPRSEQSHGHHHDDDDDEQDQESDHEEIRQVLNRFVHDDPPPIQPQHALPSRHSFQNLASSLHTMDDQSFYPDENSTAGRTTMYLLENGSTTLDRRLSHFSTNSSHASILDGERSEDVRAMFVRRVEAMVNNGTGPRTPKIEPPVPKLPEGLRSTPFRF